MVCWVPGAMQLVCWALGALLALMDELRAVSQEARLRTGKVRGTGPLKGVEGVAWKGGYWRVGALNPRMKCIFTDMLL